MRVKLRCLGLGDLVAAWVALLFVVDAERCMPSATSIGRIGLESLAYGLSNIVHLSSLNARDYP